MASRGALAAWAALMVLPVAAAVAAWGTAVAEGWALRPARPTGAGGVVVDLPRGLSAAAVATVLERHGVVGNRRAFRVLVALTGRAQTLQAGEYRFDGGESPLDVAAILAEGRVLLHAHVVAEGLALDQAAQALASGGHWSLDELLAAFLNPAPIIGIDPVAPDLEGYLFPETYHAPRGLPAPDLARLMTARFRAAWNELDGAARAADLGLSVREVATLASLVERETAVAQERSRVAAVFHNRLRRGMLMQCDPTVIHALRRDGLWAGGPLLRRHLEYDSPYNTYRYPGLPPGPISSFGRASLAAALDPAVTDDLYFVADGTGGHRFAATLAEHQRNVQAWRRYQREQGLR